MLNGDAVATTDRHTHQLIPITRTEESLPHSPFSKPYPTPLFLFFLFSEQKKKESIHSDCATSHPLICVFATFLSSPSFPSFHPLPFKRYNIRVFHSPQFPFLSFFFPLSFLLLEALFGSVWCQFLVRSLLSRGKKGTREMMRFSGSEIVVVAFLCWSLSCTAQPHRVSVSSADAAMCPKETVFDFVLGFRDTTCSLPDSVGSIRYSGVTEGDEVTLQKALNMVHKNSREYVAVLFYASWCPFSRIFRPVFSILSSLHPSIPHYAIEESSVRPSILSKYGVHGFPTLLILNSTMRVRYHGSRTLGSLIVFYNDVTGVRVDSLDQLSLDRVGHLSVHESHGTPEQESCPFSWARSPEHLLRQETYLALATAFVVLRLLYLFFPTLLMCIQFAWNRVVQNVRLGSLLEHPLVYLKRMVQSFSCLKEPCKRSNLQEGAMNAKAWASKSLASVSIGEASTSRGTHQ